MLYELAWSLKQQDKEKEAADAFAQLAEQWPDSPLAAEARYHVGEFAYKSGEFKQAAVAYYASLAKAGKTELGEKAAHKLGWSYFRLDDFANAQQTFPYQRATWPNGPLAADAAFMEAECLVEAEEVRGGHGGLWPGEANAPARISRPWRLLHAGQAAAQLKQWDKSLELLGEVRRAVPRRGLSARGALRTGLGQAEPRQARRGRGPLPAGDREDRPGGGRPAQFMIGEIQFQQKNHKEAVASFFKVSYGYAYPQWQAEATYEAGRCFEALDKREQAIKQYQELIEKFPASDKAPIAKDRIKALRQ